MRFGTDRGQRSGNKLSDPAAVRCAIEGGEESLFRELPLVRRDKPMLIYNVWAHAYGIQALVRMHGRLPHDSARRARIEQLIRGQYDRLTRYEAAEGGWGYYDFGAGTQRPNSESCSFVNATVLVAFHEAKKIGVLPPEKLVQRGMEGIIQQRNPDFSYLYGLYLRYRPAMAINRPGGSLGRSQACNVALRLWGDRKITDGVLTEWLDRLIVRNGWLDMGRKRPIPHESHFMVAGYFYYYGHYYATLCVAQLPPARRPFYQDHLANILLGHQERTAPGGITRSTTTTSSTARPSRSCHSSTAACQPPHRASRRSNRISQGSDLESGINDPEMSAPGGGVTNKDPTVSVAHQKARAGGCGRSG